MRAIIIVILYLIIPAINSIAGVELDSSQAKTAVTLPAFALGYAVFFDVAYLLLKHKEP